jgi:hypothetical protein
MPDSLVFGFLTRYGLRSDLSGALFGVAENEGGS